MNMMTGFLFRICEWIFRLVYVQMLWITFTLLGLILFGFFPSTIAMFTVVRKWMMDEIDPPIYSTFWTSYKKELVKGNAIGVLLVLSGIIIYFDYQFLVGNTASFASFSKYPLFLVLMLLGLTCIYVIPTYVHYDLKLYQIIKNAFLFMVLNPLNTIFIVIGLILIYIIAILLPPLAFFLGGSAAALIIMGLCYRSFISIEQKKSRSI